MEDLVLDRPPANTHMEWSIVGEVVVSDRFSRLLITPSITAVQAEAFLRRAVPSMRRLQQVDIAFEMNKQQALRILSVLELSTSLSTIVLFVAHTTDDVAEALSEHLRLCEWITTLGITWHQLGEHHTVPPSRRALKAIFDGVTLNQHLTEIFVPSAPPRDDEAANVAQLIANTIVEASTHIRTIMVGRHNTSFLSHLREALLRTQPSRNLSLAFWQTQFESREFYVSLPLTWHTGWQRLLSSAIPLNLWPGILARSQTVPRIRNCTCSRGSSDGIFYLLKEKPDVLLQCVRARKRSRADAHSPNLGTSDGWAPRPPKRLRTR